MKNRRDVYSFLGVLTLESLRLLVEELYKRKASKVKLPPLPMLESTEGACSIKIDPLTGISARLTMGPDIMLGGYSGFIEVSHKQVVWRSKIHFEDRYQVDTMSLDDISDTVLKPAIEYLLDIIAPIKPELPPMRADFSYQTGV